MQTAQLSVKVNSSRRLLSRELSICVPYPLWSDTMIPPTFNTGLFNAIWTVLFFFIQRKWDRMKFWQSARIVLDKSKNLDELDPNYTLAIMLFGGIIVHTIKRAALRKKVDHAYVKRIFDKPHLSLKDLMAALDGTHYSEWRISVLGAEGGQNQGENQAADDLREAAHQHRTLSEAFPSLIRRLHDRWTQNMQLIRTFFTAMDSDLEVINLRESVGKPNQAALLRQFPDKSTKPHLYLCFLVWLRAFVNRTHSICFIQRTESRDALQRYRAQINSVPSNQAAPFATNADACEIALGIYEMLRDWSVSTLEQWHRISKISVQELSIQMQLDDHTQKVLEVPSTDELVSQLLRDLKEERKQWSDDTRYYRQALAVHDTERDAFMTESAENRGLMKMAIFGLLLMFFMLFMVFIIATRI